MKLIRLTSDDNLNFKADFDADIKLGKQSSIALQNLTAQIDFVVINVGALSATVKFSLDSQVNGTEFSGILEGEYPATKYGELIEEIKYALNKTLKINTASEVGNFGNYAQFRIKNIGARTAVEFRLSPTVNPCTTRGFDPGTSTGFFIDETRFLVSDGGTGLAIGTPAPPAILLDYGTLDSQSTSSSALTKYIYPANTGVQWCQGSAVWWCRVNYLLPEVGAKEDKGFAIGLSNTRITDLQPSIPTSERQYEIRVFKEDEKYAFIRPQDAGVPQIDPTIEPQGFTVPLLNESGNDIMMIRKDKNRIRGFILQSSAAGGEEKLLFTVDLDDETQVPKADRFKPLFPYAYVCGNVAQCQMGQPTLTLNPFTIRDYGTDIEPEYANTWGNDPQDYSFETVNEQLADVVPYLDNKIYQDPSAVVSELTLHNTIWNVLGFTDGNFINRNNETRKSVQFGMQGQFQYGFRLLGNAVSPHLEGNNLVVLLDSNPLDSFDASTSAVKNSFTASKIGKRKNILCSLPYDANSANPRIEFEPNQLNFIDFDNAYPQVLRNLRLRVVDKFLSPLRTAGKSVMTLLVDTKE